MTQSQWRYLLSDVSFDEREEQAVVDVIRSGWLSMGPRTGEFERRLAEYLGVRHALATSNCTTALHLAVLAAGVGPGDEVIVPSLTFVATANAILYAGGTPVFADIESLERPLVSAADIAGKITPLTKCILVMHYGGYPCDMEAILALARERGIAVVEDAAHAIGSRYRGRACGTLGAVGCYSFFGTKNLAAGEGGAVVTGDERLFDHMKTRRSHGMTTLTWDRFKGHSFSYDVLALGYNYRMPELTAAVATAQLAKLDSLNAQRSEVARAYLRELAGVDGLVVPFAREPAPGAVHVMPVLLPPGVERTRFMERLKAEGIQSSIHYPPVHRFSHYRSFTAATAGREPSLPLTEEYARRVVTLPLHPKMTPEDARDIADTVKRSVG
jgi:dTDP-4-amino-4,6-dideoxygalactose transaminase